MVLHTSVACFGETLASLALAFTVISGFVGVVEYPHFGIFMRPDVLNQLENRRLYVLLFDAHVCC